MNEYSRIVGILHFFMSLSSSFVISVVFSILDASVPNGPQYSVRTRTIKEHIGNITEDDTNYVDHKRSDDVLYKGQVANNISLVKN